MALKIDDLLRVACSHNASDLHLKVGAFPVMRIGGELHPVENVAANVDTVRNFDQCQALRLYAEDRTLGDGKCRLPAVSYARANGIGDLFGAAHKLLNRALF